MLKQKSKGTEQARLYRAFIRVRQRRLAPAKEDLDWIERDAKDAGVRDRAEKMRDRLGTSEGDCI